MTWDELGINCREARWTGHPGVIIPAMLDRLQGPVDDAVLIVLIEVE